jgi:hypothetical protein
MANGWASIENLPVGSAAYPRPQLGEWRGKLFTALLIVSFAFNFLVQRPFLILVAIHMVLPWISAALAVLFPGDFTLSMTKKDAPRRGLATAWIFLWFSYLSVFGTVAVVSPERAVWLGCLAGAVFFLAAILVNGRCRVNNTAPGLIALALFSAIYGYGLVRELNIVLDRSPAAVYQTTVLKKSLFKSTYRLQYGEWGANGPDSIRVTTSLAHSVHEGDRICMVLKQGALGMSWYTAQACPWNGKIEFP